MRDNPLPFRLAIRYDPAMALRPTFDHAWSRSLASLALAATLLIGGHAFAQAAKDPPEVTASSVFVVNADTGQVLYAKNPDKVFRILSITKLITAYLLMQRLGGELSDQVTIAHADLVPGSTAGLRKGDVWSLQDLLYGMLLVSGNDAAVGTRSSVSCKTCAPPPWRSGRSTANLPILMVSRRQTSLLRGMSAPSGPPSFAMGGCCRFGDAPTEL